jgi:hypothetical protein
MATKRASSRSDWQRTATGALTLSLGERGARVRLFQKRKDGAFYQGLWRDGREVKSALGTHDPGEALGLGRVQLGLLLTGESGQVRDQGPVQAPVQAIGEPGSQARGVREHGSLTLQELWDRYRQECAEFLDNTRDTRTAAAAKMRVLFGFFGKGFAVDRLTKDHQRGYERAAARGHQDGERAHTRYTGTVGRIRAGVVAWHVALGHRGTLDRSPPAHRGASHSGTESAKATRDLGTVHRDQERNAAAWPRGDQGPAQAPMETTGAGISVSGSNRPPNQCDPPPPERLRQAEQAAGLPKLAGGLWHCYRRKWATERKHLPAADVAAAAGWRDIHTLLAIYSRPDHLTLARVMSEPLKVNERGVA